MRVAKEDSTRVAYRITQKVIMNVHESFEGWD